MRTSQWENLTLWMCFLLVIHLKAVTSQTLNVLKIDHIMLSGGSVPSEGNVMVAVANKTNDLPLCDDDFGMSEANAVCVRLGYPRAIRFTRQNFFGDGQTSRWTPDGWMAMYNLDCPDVGCSQLHDLDKCNLTQNQQDMCDVSEVAGVVCHAGGIIPGCSNSQFVCAEGSLTSDSCISESRVCDGIFDCSDGSDEEDKLCNREGIFRLESNIEIDPPENTTAGTILMKFNKIWGTLCHPFYGQEEARVVCRNLGYGEGVAVPVMGSYFGIVPAPVLYTEFSCSGQETSLTQCPDFIWKVSDKCDRNSIAGVFCHAGNLNVQMVGGDNIDSGHLEVRSSGLSSPAAVCGTGFDDLDAQVICRMLGYDPLQAMASKKSPPGLESDFIWNIILDCKGHEQSIEYCRFRVTNTTCPHEDTAYVSCSRGQQRSVDELLSDVLPKDCGQPVDSSNRILTSLAKIRGGKISSPFDAPWLAALQLREPLGYVHNCGAVIISEYYLLTAAHCFSGRGKLHYIVRVAEYNNNFDESFQQTFFIDKVWMHDAFEEIAIFDNDIALIKIEAKNGQGIRMGDRAKPVCLPRVGDTYDDLEDCSVAGWGTSTNETVATVLPRMIDTKPLEDEECERTYGSSRFTSSGKCFWNFFRNPCSGDSGGPVTCRTLDGRHIMYGIVSNGSPCYPDVQILDVNTRITKYLRWIQETIYKDLRLNY